MKYLLSLCLLLIVANVSKAQDQPEKFLYPVVDGKVLYEKTVDVPGKDASDLHRLAFNFIIDNFDERNKIIDDYETRQSIYGVDTQRGIYTIHFVIRIDTKDNKYRCQISNIRHTVTSQKDNVLFAKYLVDVTAETDNSIVNGEGKYSKGQRKEAQKTIKFIDYVIDDVFRSLNKAVSIRAASF